MAKLARIPSTRAVLLLAEIRDDDSPERKNGLAIRNACATEGRCPSCGAVGEVRRDPDHDWFFHWTFVHEAGCSVLSDGAAA